MQRLLVFKPGRCVGGRLPTPPPARRRVPRGAGGPQRASIPPLFPLPPLSIPTHHSAVRADHASRETMRRSRVAKPGRAAHRGGATTMHTRVTDRAVLFYTGASIFSNFHPAPFVGRPYLPLSARPAGAGSRPTAEAPPTTPVEQLLAAATDPSRPAVRFGHAEQFLMAAKAAVFGDTPSLDALLASPDVTPAAAKRGGRAVAGFDQAVWDAEVREVAFVTCLAKFSSSPERKQALLDTLPHSRRLVEAAPRDRVWGVGLGIANPDAEVPSKWRGQNLLGEALERVRAVLAAQPTGQQATVDADGAP